MILHEDLESAIDKFLDRQPFSASWRVRNGAEVVSTPLVGCRQHGALGFGYAKLPKGASLGASAEGIDFHATDPKSGQRLWTEVGEVNSRIYERTNRSGVAGGGVPAGGPNGAFTFGAGASPPYFQPPANGAGVPDFGFGRAYNGTSR